MNKDLFPDSSEYDQLAMRILGEIKKEYPTTTAKQVNEILACVNNWVSRFSISWTIE